MATQAVIAKKHQEEEMAVDAGQRKFEDYSELNTSVSLLDTEDGNGVTGKRRSPRLESSSPKEGTESARRNPSLGGDATHVYSRLRKSLATQSELVDGHLSEENREKWLTTHQQTLKRIQAMYRGYRVRREMRTAWDGAFEVSAESSNKVLRELKRTYQGFNKLIAHTAFFVVFILMVYFQLYSHSPSRSSVEMPLRHRIERTAFKDGYTIEDVVSLNDIYDYMRALTGELYAMDLAYLPKNNCTERIKDGYCKEGILGKKLYADCFETTEDSGFLDAYNRIHLSFVIIQRRRKSAPCNPNHVDVYEKATQDRPFRTCVSDEEDFKWNSSYMAEFPELLDAEVSTTLSPFKYFDSAKGFMFLMEIGPFNTGSEGAVCEWNIMQQYQWLDERTMDVCTKVVAENRNLGGSYTTAEVCFYMDIGGRVSYSVNVASSPLFFPSDQVEGLVFFSFYLIGVVTFILRFCRRSVRRVKKIFHYVPLQVPESSARDSSERIMQLRTRYIATGPGMFDVTPTRVYDEANEKKRRAKSIKHKFLVFVTSHNGLNFVLDVILIALFCVAISIYAALLQGSYDYTPVQIEIASLVFPETLSAFLTDVSVLVDLSNAAKEYIHVAVGIVVLMMVRLLEYLDFHPDVGIVTRTLRKSAVDMMYFFLLFMVVVLVYAFLGMLLIGSYSDLYGTFRDSLVELLFVALGEMEASKEAVFASGSITSEKQLFLNSLFFWSYVFLVSLLLFNVLLSIIVDTYVNIQDKKRKGESLFSFFEAFWVWKGMLSVDLKLRKNRLRSICCRDKGDNNAGSNVQVELGKPSFKSEQLEGGTTTAMFKDTSIPVEETNFQMKRRQVENKYRLGKHPKLLAWLRDVRDSCKSRVTSTMELRLILGTAFDGRTSDRVVHLMQLESIQENNQKQLHAKNRLLRLKVGDVQFTNHKMLKRIEGMLSQLVVHNAPPPLTPDHSLGGAKHSFMLPPVDEQ